MSRSKTNARDPDSAHSREGGNPVATRRAPAAGQGLGPRLRGGERNNGTNSTCMLAGAFALGLGLAGCSELYLDRRDTVSLGADDAIASNRVTHMVDPWPPHVANRNLAFNGERMQAASERYRHNRVTPPVNATTSSVAYQQAQQAAAATNAAQATAPAAPVK